MAIRADRPFYERYPVTTTTTTYMVSTVIGMGLSLKLCPKESDDRNKCIATWCLVMPFCALVFTAYIVEIAKRRFRNPQEIELREIT